MESLASQTQLQQLFATGENYDKWLIWLKSVRPRYVGTPMLARIDAQIAKGESTKSTLANVLTGARDAWEWVQNQAGGAWDALKSAVGLGFFPAVPAATAWAYAASVAAVVGAISAMTYWINDTSKVKAELETFDRQVQMQVSAGVSPDVAIANASRAQETAAASAATKGDTGLTGVAKSALTLGKWALSAFVAYKVAQGMGWVK